MAPLCYWVYRLRGGPKPDLVQALESNLSFGNILYSHFCHGMYLKHHWSRSGASGLRGAFRWIDHKLHAWMETSTYTQSQAGRRAIPRPGKGTAGGVPVYQRQTDSPSQSHQSDTVTKTSRLRSPGFSSPFGYG